MTTKLSQSSSTPDILDVSERSTIRVIKVDNYTVTVMECPKEQKAFPAINSSPKAFSGRNRKTKAVKK